VGRSATSFLFYSVSNSRAIQIIPFLSNNEFVSLLMMYTESDFVDCTNAKKCRARFGLDKQSLWCKPCRFVICIIWNLLQLLTECTACL